ncbi:MAG: methyl-accepting chemotaxis protein [Spirochaetaceae bacterium]
MNIKTRMLTLLGIPTVIAIGCSFALIVTLTTKRIGDELSNQLEYQENSLVAQISEQVMGSARSYISAVGTIANRNATEVYDNYLSGEISEEDALIQVQNVFNKEKFLGSGYIYVVDPDAIIVAHPNKTKIGGVSTTKEWLQKQDININSFYKYEYEGRDKLLLKIYNKKLEWNIMTSAYADDFSQSLDFTELNITMNNIKVGKTGYPLLLSESGKLISHPDAQLLNTDVINLKDFDGNQIFKRIIDEKEGNFRYNWKESDGSVREKFIYFKYEKNSKLYVCSTGYTDDFYGTVEVIIKLIVISGIIMIGVLFALLYATASAVAKPIKIFTTSLKDISEGDGDLTSRINVKSSGEIEVMVSSFNKFIEKLQTIILHIKNASDDTLKIKNEVSIGVEETASALHEISTNITEIKNQTNHLNENIKKSVGYSDEISQSAGVLNKSVDNQSLMLETSTAAITQMISSITNVDNITISKKQSATRLLESAVSGSKVIDQTQQAVKEVNKQLANIQEIAIVISNIAAQTNLLAMNAAIEAAHAGDAGKGFAVVADEIRKLAETSSQNSNKITTTLKNISESIVSADTLSQNTRVSFTELHKEIDDIVNALSEITTSTHELEVGGQDILESITGLGDASNVVNNSALHIQDISKKVKESMEETSDISLEVFTSIDEISQGTKGISDSMLVVTNSTYKLEETSDELNDNVNKFKID